MCSHERTKSAKGPVSGLMIGALRVYQLTLSPVFYAIGIRCRHEPTCSAYSMQSIRGQGPWRGFWLTFGRLGRCRPGGTFGFDPAPIERTPSPWWKVWAFRTDTPGPRPETLYSAGHAEHEDKEK